MRNRPKTTRFDLDEDRKRLKVLTFRQEHQLPVQAQRTSV